EQLQAAGIPFHAPAAARLSQTAAGRALVGMLALPRRGFRRAELSRWLASAPLRGPSGERVRVGRIDRIARRAGVSSGVERWRERLGHRRAELRADRAKAEERGDADALERVARNEADVDELAAFFE